METTHSKVIAYLEDDPIQRSSLACWLQQHGYDCQTFSDSRAILNAAEHHAFDAAVLDWDLKNGRSGLDVLIELRKQHLGTIPVLMYSARANPSDLQTALNAGAADCLQKSVDKMALLDRLKVLLMPSHITSVIDYGEYQDDTVRGVITVNNHDLSLLPGEYSLISRFFRERGLWISLAALQEMLKNELGEPNAQALDLYVHRLKKKIHLAQSPYWHLESLWGHGYRLVEAPIAHTAESDLTI